MITESTTAPSLIDQSIEILRDSRDGEDLEPAHLSLVEAAANNLLTERGVQAFQQLHAEVTSGKYTKPWLCGVEHVTRDHQGYVYWKGNRIEHFTFSAMDAPQLKATTQRLAEKCRRIEELGLPVCGSTYLNNWLDEMPIDFPQAYKELLHLTASLYEHDDGRAIFPLAGRTEDGWPVEARFLEFKDGIISQHSLPLKMGDVSYHALTGPWGCRLARCGQPEHTGPGAASLPEVMDWLTRHNITEQIARQLVERMKANVVDPQASDRRTTASSDTFDSPAHQMT
jgi:hypothetical protein